MKTKNLNLKEIYNRSYWFGISVISFKTAEFLSKTITSFRSKSILELGTGVGFSLSAILLGAGKKSKIISVDYSYQLFQNNHKYFKNQSKCGIINFINQDINQFLINNDVKFDTVFFDCAPQDYAKFYILLKEYLHKEHLLIARMRKGYGHLMSNYLQMVQGNYRYQSIAKEFKDEYLIVSKA